VSQTLANLEAQLGVKLFDRSARYPKLTEEGRNLLVDARLIANTIDGFKARARAMREGLEPELAVAIECDVSHGGPSPEPQATAAPDIRTRRCGFTWKRSVESSSRCWTAVAASVIIGSLPAVPDDLHAEPLLDLPFVTVVSPGAPAGGPARHHRKVGDRETRTAGIDRPDDADRRP